MINLSILLDVCGIQYTEKQLLKLEKLVNDFLKQYIKNDIKEVNPEENLPDIKTELEEEGRFNVEDELLEDIKVDEDIKVNENILNEDVTIKQNLNFIPTASVSRLKKKIPKVIFPSDISKSRVKVYDIEKVCGLKPIKFEIVEQFKIENTDLSRTELGDVNLSHIESTENAKEPSDIDRLCNEDTIEGHEKILLNQTKEAKSEQDPFVGIYGGTYPLAHFLGNFREKTKKVPTRTVSWKLTEIS